MSPSRNPTYPRPRLKRSSCHLVVAPIGFLTKDAVFDHEEPYAFKYQADGLEKLTNMETEMRRVTLYDLRGQEEMASLDTCGFEIRTLRSKMTYEQFEDQQCIKKIYLEDIKKQMREDLGALSVKIERVRVSHKRKGATANSQRQPHSLTHHQMQVRRRHPEFPKSIGTVFEHHQPSTAAHIGNL